MNLYVLNCDMAQTQCHESKEEAPTPHLNLFHFTSKKINKFV